MTSPFRVSVFLCAGILMSAPSVAAQEPRETSRTATVQRVQPARAQLRRVEAETPTLEEALADAEVQSVLGRDVRNVNLDRYRARLRANPVEATGSEDDSDHPVRPRRLLRTQQLEALSRTPRRAILQRAPSEPVAPGGPENIASQPISPGGLQPAPGGVQDLAAPPEPYLDVGGFGDDLHAALSATVNGYAMRARQNGQTIYTLQWNWAQRPGDASLGWNPNRRMHVASISKFITAMALTRLLDAEGIDFDDPIAPYLPDYWQTGPNINQIRFSDLMNHLSGFGTGGSDGSYATIRSQVAGGVPANEIGNWNTADYENMNFALCRILIATIGGYINTGTVFPIANNQIWDAVTISAYEDYVRDNVFAPAGINPNGPSLDKPGGPARGYQWTGGSGWNSGDLTGQAGGVAWHISINELLAVAGEFRRGGGIVSPARAQEILNASYGLNSPLNGESSADGRFYYKPGRWTAGDGRTEQALLLLLPDNIEIAIFVNSPIGPNGTSLQTLGRTLYVNNIVEP